jgi:maltooligosyltrehalose trehalohydrolase
VALHRDLIHLRRTDRVFAAQHADWIHGAVLGRSAFVIRFFGNDGDRLVIVNLGADFELNPAPEPLLAEPSMGVWDVMWYSESPAYGGCGRRPLTREGIWSLTAHSTVVLSGESRKDRYESNGDN